MKKLIKWLFILGGFGVVVVLAAIILVPMFVDVQSYKPEIEKKVSEATGRPFTLAGDLNLSVFPWVGVSFSDMTLGNPKGYQKKDFVKIKSFEARVKLMPLFSKEIEVKQFVLDGPEIYLEKRSDGQANWLNIGHQKASTEKKEPTPAPGKEEPGGSAGELPIKSLVIGEFAITNGRIYYSDQVATITKEVSDINLRLTDVSLERPIGLSFQANVDSKPVSLQGEVGPIGKEPGKGTLNFDVAVEALNQLSAQIKGSLKDPVTSQKFDVLLNVASFSPKKLMAALGQEFPMKTTDPMVLDKVALSLKVKGDPSSVAISDGLLSLDDSSLRFSALAKEMMKPDVIFKLELDKINIDRYLPPPAEKQSETVPTAGQPQGTGGGAPAEKQEIDYEPLRRLVVDGEVRVGELVAHGVKIRNFEMKLVGKDGLFNLDPFKLDLYEGNVSTVGTLNVQGAKPKTTVGLKTNNVQVGPLLRDSIQKDVLEGAVQADVVLQLEGDDPDMIKKTLNGKGDLVFKDGAVVGVDIAGMVRNIQASFVGGGTTAEKPRTDFAELSIPFTLTNGLFNTPDSNLSSPLLRLKMKGNAHLVKETLDFRVKPKVVGTLKGQGDTEKRSGLMVPVIVEGTFQKPEFRPDMEGVIGDLAPKKEDLLNALVSPEAGTDSTGDVVKDQKKSFKEQEETLKEQGKALEEQGKGLLKSFGFGK